MWKTAHYSNTNTQKEEGLLPRVEEQLFLLDLPVIKNEGNRGGVLDKEMHLSVMNYIMLNCFYFNQFMRYIYVNISRITFRF